MNIVVILKQTPDTESVIRIAPDGKSVVTEGLKWIVNPYDEFAVEAALRLKERHGGKITVVSLGPDRVAEALRTALAMGADEAVLIRDDALQTEDLSLIAKALAAAVKELNPDIALVGSRAVDYEQGERGPIVARTLGWPHLALAVSIECDGAAVGVERPIEGGRMRLESTLPAVVTLGGSHAVWNPRYATLPGIMKAKKKPLSIKKLSDLGLNPSDFSREASRVSITSFEPPARRPPGRMIDGDLDTRGKARELVRALREEAKVI